MKSGFQSVFFTSIFEKLYINIFFFQRMPMNDSFNTKGNLLDFFFTIK